MFRQFVSARTHRATTCFFAYVCVFICMQSINQNQNQNQINQSKSINQIKQNRVIYHMYCRYAKKKNSSAAQDVMLESAQ